ncbi:MAG TPA: hypothetical protein VMG58_14415, partial [Candidatus Sulfotelmatobacter sp.]|nr:hypothetical protein [Candidatus Sulfotelmatobacter sp.]
IQQIRVARIDLRETDPRRGSELEVHGLTGTGQPARGRLDLDLRAASVRVADPERTERVEQLAGVGSVEGEVVRIGRLSGVWLGHRVEARGEVREIATRPDLRLRVEGAVDLGRLVGRYAQVPVQGLAQASLEVRGPITALEVSGQARAPALLIWKLHGRNVLAEGRWASGKLALSTVEAGLWNGRLQGTLELTPAHLAATRVEVQLRDVAIEELASLVPSAPAGLRGRLTLSGEVQGDPRHPEDFEGPFTLAAAGLELPGALARLGPGTLEAAGGLARQNVDLARAEGRWGGLRVQARGGLTEAGPRALTLAVEGDLAELARFLPRRDVTGRAVLRAELSGRWPRPDAAGRFEAPAVTAFQTSLQDVHLPFHFAGNLLAVTGGSALLGSSRLLASATAALPPGWAPADGISAVRFHAELQAPALRLVDLDHWLPPAWRGSGTIAFDAALDGTPPAWQGTGHLVGRQLLAPRGIPVRSVAATFRLDANGLEVPDLTASLQGIPIAAHGRYAWAGEGEAQAGFGPADLARLPGLPARPVLGGTVEGRLRATVAAGAVSADGQARGRRLTASGVALGDASAEARVQGRRLEATCALPGLGLSSSVRGALDPGATLDADVLIRSLAVQPLLQALVQRADLDLHGSVSGRATLVIPVGNPGALRARATLEPVALTIAGDAWSNQGPVVVRWEGGALHLDRLLLTSRLGSLEARGSVPQAGQVDLA